MDIALLRSFVAVAETGSFSVAGQRLNLTQSTISHQIARLEEQLGRRLFDRTTRRCKPTGVGLELLNEAQALVRKADELQHRFRKTVLRGRVRLGVPDDFHLFQAITEAIAEFSTDHPQVNLDIIAGLSQNLGEAVAADELDLAIIRKAHVADEPCIVTEELIWIEKAAAFRKETSLLPLAFVAEPCLYRSLATAGLHEAGLPFRQVVTCSNMLVVMAFVEAGLASSVALRPMITPNWNVAERHDLPSLPRTALVFRAARRSETVLVRELKSCLERKIQETAV